MVFSSWQKVSLVFRSWWSLIAGDQSVISRQPVADWLVIIGTNWRDRQRLIVGWLASSAVIYMWWSVTGRRWAAITCHDRWQLYNKHGSFARPIVAHRWSQNICDYYAFLSPMVAGGLWWSVTILVVGGREPVFTHVWLGLKYLMYLATVSLFTVYL